MCTSWNLRKGVLFRLCCGSRDTYYYFKSVLVFLKHFKLSVLPILHFTVQSVVIIYF